jgi:hypothetical protein
MFNDLRKNPIIMIFLGLGGGAFSSDDFIILPTAVYVIDNIPVSMSLGFQLG